MMKDRILMIGAGFALVLVMFVGCGGRSGEKEFNKAIKAWDKGNRVQARALFEKAAARLSGNARKSTAFNKLGLVLWQLDDPRAAAAAFNDACTLSETITDARLNLAYAEFHSGDLDGATKSVNMYLGENPDNPSALALKSLLAAKKRDWAQSARLMAEAATGNPNDPAAQNALALAELNHGQGSTTAITRLKKITTSQPDYAPAYYNLGVIYEQWLQDKAAALGYYQTYLQKTGDAGSHAEAARQAMARLSGQPTATVMVDPTATLAFMQEGARLHGEGKYAEAVEQFQKAIAVDARQKNAFYNMGLSYYALKKYDESAQACRNALGIDAGFADARYMLALSYVQQKNWDDAEREAKELSNIDAKRGRELLTFIAGARK